MYFITVYSSCELVFINIQFIRTTSIRRFTKYKNVSNCCENVEHYVNYHLKQKENGVNVLSSLGKTFFCLKVKKTGVDF